MTLRLPFDDLVHGHLERRLLGRTDRAEHERAMVIVVAIVAEGDHVVESFEAETLVCAVMDLGRVGRLNADNIRRRVLARALTRR